MLFTAQHDKICFDETRVLENGYTASFSLEVLLLQSHQRPIHFKRQCFIFHCYQPAFCYPKSTNVPSTSSGSVSSSTVTSLPSATPNPPTNHPLQVAVFHLPLLPACLLLPRIHQRPIHFKWQCSIFHCYQPAFCYPESTNDPSTSSGSVPSSTVTSLPSVTPNPPTTHPLQAAVFHVPLLPACLLLPRIHQRPIHFKWQCSIFHWYQPAFCYPKSTNVPSTSSGSVPSSTVTSLPSATPNPPTTHPLQVAVFHLPPLPACLLLPRIHQRPIHFKRQCFIFHCYQPAFCYPKSTKKEEG